MRAHFDGLPPLHGDVLVAADGIHSTVRSVLFPAEGPPRWNGVTMWRGCADWPVFGTGQSMLVAGGNAAKLVVYPIGHGKVAIVAAAKAAVEAVGAEGGVIPGDLPAAVGLTAVWQALADSLPTIRRRATAAERSGGYTTATPP